MVNDINTLRTYLFAQDMENVMNQAMIVLEKMGNKINLLSQEEISYYRYYVNEIGSFLSKGDYLAVTDIIKYELFPLFKEKEN